MNLVELFESKVERLDELSKEKLRDYLSANASHPAREIKKGKVPFDKAAKRSRLDVGKSLATNRMDKYRDAEYSEQVKKHSTWSTEAGNHFEQTAHDALTTLGFTHHGRHPIEGSVYSKYQPKTGVLNTFKLKNNTYENGNPHISLVHTAIQGSSYVGHSALSGRHYSHNEESHHEKMAKIPHEVHEYIANTLSSSDRDAASAHSYYK